MPRWSDETIKAIVDAVRQTVSAIFAYFAGRKSVKDEVQKEKVRDLQEVVEATRRIDQRRDDPDDRERVRERHLRTEDD